MHLPILRCVCTRMLKAVCSRLRLPLMRWCWSCIWPCTGLLITYTPTFWGYWWLSAGCVGAFTMWQLGAPIGSRCCGKRALRSRARCTWRAPARPCATPTCTAWTCPRGASSWRSTCPRRRSARCVACNLTQIFGALPLWDVAFYFAWPAGLLISSVSLACMLVCRDVGGLYQCAKPRVSEG